MKPHVAAVAVLVALAVGAQAQTPEIDALRARAEQGDAAAQNALGFRYRTGRGVPQDDVEAVRWFRLAAEQGDADAQFFLGGMYATGRGVLQDHVEAVRWSRLAAEQGHAGGQYNLGWMYRDGQGVVQDEAEAVRWFRLRPSRDTPRRSTTSRSEAKNVCGEFPEPVEGRHSSEACSCRQVAP